MTDREKQRSAPGQMDGWVLSLTLKCVVVRGGDASMGWMSDVWDCGGPGMTHALLTFGHKGEHDPGHDGGHGGFELSWHGPPARLGWTGSRRGRGATSDVIW